MVTRSFKVYGINFDKTGTNNYSVIKITQNTNEECMQELFKQISHGFFENEDISTEENVLTTEELLELGEKNNDVELAKPIL